MIANNGLKPQKTIYYQGAIIIKILFSLGKTSKSFDVKKIFEIFKSITSNIHGDESFSSFMIVLDWIFLLGIIDLDSKGNIILK